MKSLARKEEDVHVFHTAPQTRLNRIGVPAIYPHDKRPAQTRKNRPGIP